MALTLKMDAPGSTTKLGWKIRTMHGGVSGVFGSGDASLVVDKENYSNNKLTATVESKTLDSKNGGRDKKARGKDFFDVDAFPKIEFESTSGFKPAGSSEKVVYKPGDKFDVTGTAKIAGVEKDLTLNVEVVSVDSKVDKSKTDAASTDDYWPFEPASTDGVRYGGALEKSERYVVLRLTGSLKRKEFNIGKSMPNFVVKDDVAIDLTTGFSLE